MTITYDYNVIHCINNNERFENIKKMETKLEKKINIFSGIIGKNVDLTKINMYDNNLILKYKPTYIGEIGCYLSHYMLFKNLLFSNNDYTVIFEDDLTINVNDLDEKINNILNNIDINVDFIFLGTQSRYFGKCYKNNLFYIHERAKIWGFQGYIINNKNITKILNNIQNITCEIDIKIFSLIKQKKLFGLFVNPSYINQNIIDKIEKIFEIIIIFFFITNLFVSLSRVSAK